MDSGALSAVCGELHATFFHKLLDMLNRLSRGIFVVVCGAQVAFVDRDRRRDDI
jgi:hypothetical protein